MGYETILHQNKFDLLKGPLGMVESHIGLKTLVVVLK